MHMKYHAVTQSHSLVGVSQVKIFNIRSCLNFIVSRGGGAPKKHEAAILVLTIKEGAIKQ